MIPKEPAPARASTRSPAVLGVLLVLLALCLSACAAASPAEVNPSPDAGTQPGLPPVSAPTTTTVIPDQLADPGVGPGECKVVVYTPPGAKDPFPGELCRPKDNQRDVAVVVVHGGSGIGGSYQGMRRWANRYLVEGYVTFLPEYHLFNPGGETPVFPRPEQNIKAAVQYLRGVGNALGIAKDRIVVQGQSAGARIAAVAFTSPDDPWFAGPELYSGISDKVNGLIGFYHPYDGTMQYADQYFGGPESSTDPQVKARLDKGDSLSHAANADGPALFIVGDQDWSIIIQQQEAFALILLGNHHQATSIVIKGGGHGFDEGGPRLSKLGEESAVDTLTWLNDSFPQDPVRSAQSADADVANAPTYSGVPPTTYQARPAPSGGYGSYANNGGSSSGSKAPATTYPYVPPSSAPASTSPPVTSPPVTEAPVTTAPAPPTTHAPPVTVPPVTTPPVTTPPTSAKPPPTTAPPAKP